jgi:hypothetical protein
MLDAAVENAETQQKKEIHKPQHNTTHIETQNPQINTNTLTTPTDSKPTNFKAMAAFDRAADDAQTAVQSRPRIPSGDNSVWADVSPLLNAACQGPFSFFLLTNQGFTITFHFFIFLPCAFSIIIQFYC